MKISAIIPTRNPNLARLGEVLASLKRQNLPTEAWELLLVDNASDAPLPAELTQIGLRHARAVVEPRPGLLWARLCGIRHSVGEYLVFVDDDTVLDSNFLSAAADFMDARPRIGSAGGKIAPRFECPPPPWIETVAWSLALRDNGEVPFEWSLASGTAFPNWTPIGAGLVVRRTALVPAYEQHVARHWRDIERISWQGQGGGGVEDKDIVLHCLRAGWAVGYAPNLRLTHLIPAARLERSYFENLLPSLERMWMRTLHAHGLNPLRPIRPLTLRPRQIKAWLALRAWRSPANRFQWLCSCGRLRGLAENASDPVQYGLVATTR